MNNTGGKIENMLIGEVVKVNKPEEGSLRSSFGFIQLIDETNKAGDKVHKNLFFSEADLVPGTTIDDLATEAHLRVQFVIEDSVKGPHAIKVSKIPKN